MKYINLTLTLLIIAQTILSAESTMLKEGQPEETLTKGRVGLNFKSSAESGVTPEFFFPLYWGEHLMSGLGYDTQKTSQTTTLDDLGLAPSNVSTSITEDHIWLNIISYLGSFWHTRYAIGLNTDYRQIEKKEFAYYHNGGTLNAIESSVDIKQYSLGISGDLTWAFFDALNLRLSGSFSPYTILDVKQSLTAYPYIGSAVDTSRVQQKLTYKTALDLYYKTGYGFDVGLGASYEMLPLSYYAAVIDASGSYQNYKIDSQEATGRIELKTIITSIKTFDLYPMIGYGYENVTESSNYTQDASANRHLILFGFENKF